MKDKSIAVGKGKNKVKITSNFHFTPLHYKILKWLQDGEYPSKIAKLLGKSWSKQKVNYYISCLKEYGLIEKIPNIWPSRYILTDKGKKFLIEGEVLEKMYDLHNVEVTLPIVRIGSLPKGDIRIKNWYFRILKFGLFTVKVNYGKQPNLIIYPPKSFGDKPSDTLIDCGMKIKEIIELLESQYNCKIDTTRKKVNRMPHFHALQDPIAKELGKQKVRYSGKNIDINHSGDAHLDILGFDAVEKYDKLLDLPSTINKLVSVLDKFGRQIELHLGAYEGIKQQSEATTKLVKSLQKLLSQRTLRDFT